MILIISMGRVYADLVFVKQVLVKRERIIAKRSYSVLVSFNTLVVFLVRNNNTQWMSDIDIS